jgi:hypothetical protein
MNYSELKAELDAGHPVTGAYNADDALAADELNAENRTITVESVSGSAILNATNDTEYLALADAEKTRWLGVCGADSIDISNGVAKAEEADLFGPGTTTRANLAALKVPTVSRAMELGFGLIEDGDVTFARAL